MPTPVVPTVAPIAPSAIAPPIAPGELLLAFARFGDSSGDVRDRVANGSEPFRDTGGIRSCWLRTYRIRLAAPGEVEPSSSETPTAPAGVISDKILRYFFRSDIRILQSTRANGTLETTELRHRCLHCCYPPGLLTNSLPVIKLGRAFAPKAARVRQSGQRRDSPAHALRADSRGSSGTH